MKYTNEFMLMIAKVLYGELDVKVFSYDFPERLSAVFDDFQAENRGLCDYLEEEMPELCAAFDPYGTGEDGTLDAVGFRGKVLEVYQTALPMSMRPAS